MSAEVVERSAAAQRGKTLSAEHRASISAALRGRPQSQDGVRKRAIALTGKEHSPETKAKMSASKRNAPPLSGTYKGVSYNSASKKWKASIYSDGVRQHLGYFTDEVSGALAYDAAAVQRWGAGNCFLNFPQNIKQTG